MAFAACTEGIRSLTPEDKKESALDVVRTLVPSPFYARSVIRYTFGELDTKTFYNATARDSKTAAAKEELNRLLQPHGIADGEVFEFAKFFRVDFTGLVIQAGIDQFLWA